jgi:hypothetical protein
MKLGALRRCTTNSAALIIDLTSVIMLETGNGEIEVSYRTFIMAISGVSVEDAG